MFYELGAYPLIDVVKLIIHCNKSGHALRMAALVPTLVVFGLKRAGNAAFVSRLCFLSGAYSSQYSGRQPPLRTGEKGDPEAVKASCKL